MSPNRHLHSPYDMIMDEEGTYSVCRVCEQAWNLTDRGWIPVETGRTENTGFSKRKYYAERGHKKKGSLNRGGRKK